MKNFSTLLLFFLVAGFPLTAQAVCSNNEDGQPGQNGEMEFFTATDTLTYCDDTNWTDMIDINSTLNLVGHWKLDETSGTVAGDSSGNGNDGTMQNGLTGASTTNGAVNTALTLSNATSERIRILDLTDFDFASFDAFTVAGWAKPVSGSDELNIFRSGGSFNNASQMSFGLRLYNVSGTQWQFQISDGTSARTLFGGTRTNDVWHHIAATWDGTTMRLYQDGVEVNSTSPSFGTLHNGSFAQVYVASSSAGETDGDVDDIYAYTRALSATEISTLYNKGGNRGLVGHWKLDETSGTVAADSSGNGNTGTMINGLNGTADSVDGKIDGGLNFIDADNHAIDTGNDPSINDIFIGGGTISLWTKLRADQSSSFVIKTTNTSTMPDGFVFTINLSSRYAQLKQSFSGGRIEFRTSAGVPKDEWIHLAVVYDSSSTTNDPIFYVNGIAVASGRNPIGSPVDPPTSDSALSMILGGFSAEHEMDDVRVYNRQLSANEILGISSCTKSGSWFYNYDIDVAQWCESINLPINMAIPASGVGGCAGGQEGTFRYSTDRYQFCDGNGWIDIGK